MKKKFIKRTIYFKSRSSNVKYVVERHRNGTITCWCPGFMYWQSDKRKKPCWHYERAKQWK